MLRNIRWASFLTLILTLTALYYLLILTIFYRKEIKAIWQQALGRQGSKGLMVFLLMLSCVAGHAQTADGNNGINQANTMVRSYYETAVNLMYAVGALLALFGAVDVYLKWNRTHGEASRAAAAWFGGCVFLVVVTTVIKSFFGF